MKQFLLFAAIVLLSTAGLAQSRSGIAVKVIDKNGKAAENWPVVVYQGGREVMTAYTDEEGEALAKPLGPNVYQIRVTKDSVERRMDDIALGISETIRVTVDFQPHPVINEKTSKHGRKQRRRDASPTAH